MSRTILFLCAHNAAKSVMAAAYFTQMATQHQLDFEATSAGTEPDAKAAPAVVEMLKQEGIDVSNHIPRQVTREELADAFRIVSLGCEVCELAPSKAVIMDWNDIPPASQNLVAARSKILEHLERLIDELRHTS